MANTVLLRIDDRLLHGQIGKYWLKEVGADLIVVANDKLSDNNEDQKLMNLTVPIGTKTYFLSMDSCIKDLEEIEAGNDALVIVEGPSDALRLIEAGLSIQSINVGNMRNTGYKKEVNPSVYVDDEDREVFNKIIQSHKSLDLRSNPSDDPSDYKKLL